MEDQPAGVEAGAARSFHRMNVSAGGDASGADVGKESLIGDEADRIGTTTMIEDSTDVIAVCGGAIRRRRRCRRKRKAGDHHRAPQEADQRRSDRGAWKPYTDMTWDERKAKDELQASRAARRRDRRFASGQAMAPDNTTQFLMEQYDAEGVDRMRLIGVEGVVQVAAVRPRTPESSATGGDSTSVGGDEDDEERSAQEELFFLEREFNEAYNRQQAERLEGMTKDELIRDYIQMEETVERLKSRLDTTTVAPVPAPHRRPEVTLDYGGIELKQLLVENARLVLENDRLRMEMNNVAGGSRVRVKLSSPEFTLGNSPIRL